MVKRRRAAAQPVRLLGLVGYLGATNYPIHGGAQIETIMNEVRALGG